MRLSVVIPTLNEEKYLPVTLFHVFRTKPYEVIVSDGGSKDMTREIAKNMGAKVVVKRGNVSIGRNAGAKVARGNVILFLDADTIVYDNILDVISKDFKNKDVVGWTCNVYAFSPSWKEQQIYRLNNILVNFLINVVKKPHAAGIALAVRRDVFWKAGGFDEKLRVMEDHDLCFRLSKFGKFKFSKDTCVFTSTRRITKWGGMGLLKKYAKIYLEYMIKNKKNFDNEDIYEVIR